MRVREIIHQQETIIGFASDIIDECQEEMEDYPDYAEQGQDLINELEPYVDDDDLVICDWHPMGAWVVRRLKAEC